MSDKQQSAVDWLVEHLKEYGFDLSCHTLEINQAKELFKQQIIDASEWFTDITIPKELKEEVYNETFKTESNGK